MDDLTEVTVSLRLLVLRTPQLEAVRRFYQAVGIRLTGERHGAGPLHYAGPVGDTVFEVYPLRTGDPADATTRLGFAVGNLDRALAALQAEGATVITPPGQTAWGYRAVIRDPDGRAVDLYQRQDKGDGFGTSPGTDRATY